MNNISGLLEKFGNKIPALNVPWHQYADQMSVITPYIAKANILFPIDTALTIISIRFVIAAILLIIWTIQFVRKMLPF